MKFIRLFRIKRSRKYPIQRDGSGFSLRARCFERFEQGKRPDAVAEELKIKYETVCRYFRDWKKLGPNFELHYAYVKSLFNKTALDRDKNIELFARVWGIEKERLEDILSQSHGLHRLMTGKFYSPAHADADHKLHLAMELALHILDHVTKQNRKFEDVNNAILYWMKESKQYREEEDADTEEENKFLELVRIVLKAEIEKERENRVKPETLTAQEHNAVNRLIAQAELEDTQKTYWLRISRLMAYGLTPEQARERFYQDVLAKGDQKMAKTFRDFQDKYHPLKTNDQLQPPTPPIPPISS